MHPLRSPRTAPTGVPCARRRPVRLAALALAMLAAGAPARAAEDSGCLQH